MSLKGIPLRPNCPSCKKGQLHAISISGKKGIGLKICSECLKVYKIVYEEI